MRLSVTLTLFYLCFFKQSSGALNYQDALKIAQLDDQKHFDNALQNILIPRVASTEGSKKVQNFIISEMESMGMTVEQDSFYDNAPIFGKINFVNIIGKINPNADRFLMLSAHYDSKYFPDNKFVGATDSAVPCALMLNIVKTTLPYIQNVLKDKNLGLMLVFFDGEEAFEQWTDTDSLYGSRHLAKKWEQTKYKNEKEIDRINVMVLLDLIGSGNARFVCSTPNTCPLNKRLVQIENTLREASSLKAVGNGNRGMFLNSYRSLGVSDDHIPFQRRGVSILHLIPMNFPSTWHTNDDDGRNLNHNSIYNFNKVMRIFVLDYLTTCVNNPKSKNCSFK
ncbi:glutaminyl-peptide cyclotransferase-like [Chironomus tepperi]|uniref:glutaminyl-peptide cyclotransferase-like n=1 Tax=Chironomus tepperi TaxID=113505 RepID=UPI00391F556E